MSGAGESFGQASGQLLRIVFTPLFPFILVTACGLSYLLMENGYPQFAALAYLAAIAIRYAHMHLWAMCALGAFVLGAVPLAWVAYREMPVTLSGVIGHWIGAVLGGAFTYWLAGEWPPPNGLFGYAAFAFLLFGLCGSAFDGVLGTIKLIALTRPQPGREVVEAQKAHGHAQIAGEAEALALLNSKK